MPEVLPIFLLGGESALIDYRNNDNKLCHSPRLFEPANDGHDPDDFVFNQPNHLAKDEHPGHLSVDKRSIDDDLAKDKQLDHSDIYE